MKKRGKQILNDYALYDREDNLLMVGTARECAEYIGCEYNNFKNIVHKTKIKKAIKYKAYKLDDESEVTK